MAEGESSPHLIPQRVQLALKLLAGLDLLVQLPLQLLLSVFQTLDLLLCLVHLSLRRLQSLSELRGAQKWDILFRVSPITPLPSFTWSLSLCRLTCSSSACIFISFTLRSSLRFACCRLLLSLREREREREITSPLQLPVTLHSQFVLHQRCSPSYNHRESDLSRLSVVLHW